MIKHPSQKYVVLDRDGVINVDSKNYIKRPAEWIAIEGSLEAIARLNRHGYTVVVATNQSGLARGLFTQADLSEIHLKLESELNNHHGMLGGIFYCPHGPDQKCDCRKPNTGLLNQIESFFGCSLKDVPFIGDSVRDIQAAQRHGCKPILVETGNGLGAKRELAEMGDTCFELYPDLSAAVDALINNETA